MQKRFCFTSTASFPHQKIWTLRDIDVDIHIPHSFILRELVKSIYTKENTLTHAYTQQMIMPLATKYVCHISTDVKRTLKCIVINLFNQVIEYIHNGILLDCPKGCPKEVYKIMLGSWQRQPTQRMLIKDLHDAISQLSDENTPMVDIVGRNTLV